MNLRKIYTIVIILLIVAFHEQTIAQTTEQQENKVNNLYNAKNYDEAYWLYHRIWFFADPSLKSKIHSNYINSAFHSKQFKTVKYLVFNEADSNNFKPSENEIILGIASILNLEQWQECINLTSFYLSDSINQNANFNSNLLYFKLLSEVKMQKKANVILTATLLKGYTSSAQNIGKDSLINAFQIHQSYSPNKVKILSTFVPGLGQLFIKDFKNAGNAFLLNATLISAFVITAQLYNWPQSILFWVYYIPHYYLGNAKSAKELCEKKNENQNNLFFEAFKNW